MVNDVFWHKADDYLVDLFKAAMGPSSAYTTLKAQTINSDTYADAFEWSRWVHPSIAISVRSMEKYEIREHTGAGQVRYEKVCRGAAYGVLAGKVKSGTNAVSELLARETKEFYERMEAVLTAATFSDVRNDIFIARSAKIVAGGVDIIRYTDDGNESDRRLGIASIYFDIQVR